ncbi:MAG: copper transporter [Acidimicrobiales bacterium]
MVNFRYHIISIVAVFLALGIGVVMGSAVIDQTVVDTLKEQQGSINERVDQVVVENGDLRTNLSDLQGRSKQLADEGSERLLAGTLAEVPVLVLAVRGVESEGLDDLVNLLGTAEADYQGTLWFTSRFVLDKAEDRRDLARVLGQSDQLPASVLRTAAIGRLTDALAAGASAEPRSVPVGQAAGPPAQPTLGSATIAELREAGFVDYDAPDGAPEGTAGLAAPGTRMVLVAGPNAVVADALLALPVARALVGEGNEARVAVLAAEAFAAGDGKRGEFTEALQADDVRSLQLSTVNDIDDFAGRLAAVLALQDLGEGRVGHYGRGARLIPAPAG